MKLQANLLMTINASDWSHMRQKRGSQHSQHKQKELQCVEKVLSRLAYYTEELTEMIC